MKKIFVLVLSTIVFLALPMFFVQAQNTETITIATYYPSPHGIYQELKTQRMAIGQNYSDSAYCWPPAVCAHQIDADADLVVEGRVGIGTETPGTPLQVDGGIRENDGIFRNRLRVRQTATTGLGGTELELHNIDPDGRWAAAGIFVRNWDILPPVLTPNQLNITLKKEQAGGAWAFVNAINLYQNGDTALGILGTGNVGIGTTTPRSGAPNGASGNLDANDIYLRSANAWASSLMGLINATWHNVSGSRAKNTWYQNNRTYPIQLTVATSSVSGENFCRAVIYIDTDSTHTITPTTSPDYTPIVTGAMQLTDQLDNNPDYAKACTVTVTIPVGYYYAVVADGFKRGNVNLWWELY